MTREVRPAVDFNQKVGQFDFRQAAGDFFFKIFAARTDFFAGQFSNDHFAVFHPHVNFFVQGLFIINAGREIFILRFFILMFFYEFVEKAVELPVKLLKLGLP